jgi:putative oxidoreductase
LLLIAGFQTRLIALALAGFSLAAAVIFHSNLADQTMFVMFFKNVSMAGGFLIIAVHGAGAFSLDRKLSK